MFPSFFVLLSLLSVLPFSSLSFSSPFNVSYHIDCGGSATITDDFATTWLSDRCFTGGATAVVSEPLRFSFRPQKTLRFFPPTTTGKKNCYLIPATPGARYLFRTFTVYDNYDGKNRPPRFEVAIEGTVVFSYRSPWPETLARDGSYSDLFAFVSGDGEADVCFYSFATDPPLVGTLEIIQVDPESYSSSAVGPPGHVLVNYGRLTCGQDEWGAGLSNDTDVFGRQWQSDADFRSNNTKGVKVISTTVTIGGVNQRPNYFPMKLYGAAVSSNGVIEYQLSVDAKLDYLLWFHFAEIDPQVKKAGQRVFDVLINGVNVNRIDVFKAVGGFKAYDWHYVAKNLNSTTLAVRLNPIVRGPIICGLENYAIVPSDLATVPEQVMAMKALKDSLRVPDRMGWNGDPCGPTSWDAWEGVTCRTNKDGNALVIFQIDLGSQGLKGFVSDQISLLTNLASLNLSSNSLGGALPEGLGHQSLVKLDLSNNEFVGAIPDTLATSTNLRLVLLNNNQLEGQVPDQMYSIGVHGGAIDLSRNKGLCGVPSLPDCSLFWNNGQLSNDGKIAIGVSFTVAFILLLVVTYICIRRNRNDYDFGIPHELMSMAAKRNRYQRQKSLMDLEMESQHAKGLISPT
uniref:Malectin-like domain-containing protein n=2 Tax=Opuntia streptacantha TaxID=393608 RepID=A0A7C9AV70_OPUST